MPLLRRKAGTTIANPLCVIVVATMIHAWERLFIVTLRDTKIHDLSKYFVGDLDFAVPPAILQTGDEYNDV